MAVIPGYLVDETQPDYGRPATKGALISLSGVVFDSVAPAITNFVAPTTRAGFSTFEVTDLSPGLRLVQLWIKFAGDDRRELVYDGSNFMPRFTGVRTPIANGYAFSVTQNGGWQDNVDLFWVQAVDQHGNLEAMP